jgi:hypothetical protein
MQAIKSKLACCFKTEIHNYSFDTRKKIWKTFNKNFAKKIQTCRLPFPETWILNSLLSGIENLFQMNYSLAPRKKDSSGHMQRSSGCKRSTFTVLLIYKLLHNEVGIASHLYRMYCLKNG